MKTAFSFWNHRIAPVFDTARNILVIERDSGVDSPGVHETLPPGMTAQKALQLRKLRVADLVCGAISRPMFGLITAYGIRVTPFIAGDLNTVVHAWRTGTLQWERFAMPGCCGPGRRWSSGGMEDICMNADGQKPGQRVQSGRRSRGRMGGPLAAGPSGFCVCPKCGHREEHQRGAPCVERHCSKCGTAMMRQ